MKQLNETKEQKSEFMVILSGTLVASLLGNMLADKGVIWGGDGVTQASEGIRRSSNAVIPASEGVIRAGKHF